MREPPAYTVDRCESTHRSGSTSHLYRLIRKDRRRQNSPTTSAARHRFDVFAANFMTARHVFNWSRRRSSGITVTEMLIAVAILAVLAAIAAPNLRSLFINNRLETANSEFIAALNVARSEAMRRGARVAVLRVGT